MDIDALHSGLLSVGIIAEKVRRVRASLPAGPKRAKIRERLAQVELDLKLAETTMASELGFHLCGCCWPPELMLEVKDRKLCRRCGAEPQSLLDRTRPKNNLLPLRSTPKGSNGRMATPGRTYRFR